MEKMKDRHILTANDNEQPIEKMNDVETLDGEGECQRHLKTTKIKWTLINNSTLYQNLF